MTKGRAESHYDEQRLRLHNARPEIERAEAALKAAAEGRSYPAASVFALRLAFEEAVINAFRHGHAGKPKAPIEVRWRVDPERVVITVEDQGPGFDPDSLPDPTLEENLERPSGRGIMLMRAYMTRVEFNEAGNRVVMTYERPKAPGPRQA